MSELRLKIPQAGEPVNADNFDPGGSVGDTLTKLAPPSPGLPPDYGWRSGIAAAFSTVRFVDPGTAVPTARQNGSQDAPFKTLAQALAAVPAGGVIWAVPHDYSAEGLLTTTKDVNLVSLSPQIPDDLAGGVLMNSANVLVDSVAVGAGFTFSAVQVKTTNVLGIAAPTTATVKLYSCDTTQISGDGAVYINNTHVFDIACAVCVAQSCSLAGFAITCSAGGLSVVLFDCDFSNAFNVTFGAPGVLTLRGTSYPRWLLAAGTITNGEIFSKTVGHRARISVAVPAIAVPDTTAYFDLNVAATPLGGAIAAGVPIAANPTSDLAAGGLNGGQFINCYCSAADNIRMLFRGVLAGGGAADFDFTLL